MIPMQKVFYFILQDKRGGSFYNPPPVYSHSNQFLAAKMHKKIERNRKQPMNPCYQQQNLRLLELKNNREIKKYMSFIRMQNSEFSLESEKAIQQIHEVNNRLINNFDRI